jgi:hypothetical protein
MDENERGEKRMKINLCTVLGAKFVYSDLKVPHYIVATKGTEIRLFKAASVLSFWNDTPHRVIRWIYRRRTS